MTTMATTVREIRSLLKDRPATTALNDGTGINTTDTAIVVDDAPLVRAGTTYEFDDGSGDNAECIKASNSNSLTMTAVRAVEGTTAASHSDNVVMLVDPLYRYNTVAATVNMVLATDLYQAGLYDIIEHEITTSATTNHYNSSATTCERILNVYQDLTTSTTNEPKYLHYQDYRHIDSDKFSNEKYFVVFGGTQDGTQILYVNCIHPLAITTVSEAQNYVVKYLAAARLLEWEDAHATVDQNERKARVGDRARLARYFEDKGKRMLAAEVKRLQHDRDRVGRRFIPRSPRIVR